MITSTVDWPHNLVRNLVDISCSLTHHHHHQVYEKSDVVNNIFITRFQIKARSAKGDRLVITNFLFIFAVIDEQIAFVACGVI